MKRLLPREKALLSGVRSLSDDELLAVILSTGTKGKSVFQIAKEISSEFTLKELSDMTIKALSKIGGIGKVKAVKLSCAFELGRRVYALDEGLSYENLRHLFKEIGASRKEKLVLVMYDGAGCHLSTELIALGGANSVWVHPREVFEPVFKNGASQFILAHNHPSGDPNPSDEDLVFTSEIKDLSERLGLKMLESFVIGKRHAVGILTGITIEL